MKNVVVALAAVALCICAWAADNATVGASPTANQQSAIGSRQSAIDNGADAITIPQMLSYQGKLTDTFEVPVADTTYSVTFRLFTVLSGGTAFWNETQTVRTRSGLFSCLLGRSTPIAYVPDAGNLYLEMQVNPDPAMTPRVHIVSAAYAYKADTANYALAGGGGGGDNAWVRSGSDSVLYTIRQLGIARGGASNKLWGTSAFTHINLGVACTTGVSGQNYANATVGGGTRNGAKGNDATVGGGYVNTANGSYATVGGGSTNAATALATVGGGLSNTAGGGGAVIGGGTYNSASGTFATVAGGCYDTAMADNGGVFSGYDNLAGDAATDTAACVAGGKSNSAIARYTFIGGGYQNYVNYYGSNIGGGYYNRVSGLYSTIGGGYADTVGAQYSCVLGGRHNVAGRHAADSFAVVCGGEFNEADSTWAFVGGGGQNIARGYGATVCGGRANATRDAYATVSGGYINSANGSCATVSGGSHNQAEAVCSSIGGGANDTVAGNYGFAAGLHSLVRSGDTNSVALNGTTTSGDRQTRVYSLVEGFAAMGIDHPLDPQSRILNQYTMASSEMVLFYRGAATINSDGRVAVQLPNYFDALCRNPMVQLTGVGTSDVFVVEKVTGNSFSIGGKPGAEVFWTVTAERKDPVAEQARTDVPVVQAKTDGLQGRSVNGLW